MNLTLVSTSSDQATTGTLTAGSTMFFTLEPPWRDNEQDNSCVPAGVYDLIPYDSPKHGPTWCLRNPVLSIMGCDALTSAEISVGCRTVCEIHSANWVEQLKGCIALGLEDQPMLDPMTGCVEPAIENSRDAVAELISLLGAMSSGHTLSIQRL